MRCSSRFSAWRRELNSHNAASREQLAGAATPRSSQTPSTERGLNKYQLQHAFRASSDRETNPNDWEPACQGEPLHCLGGFGFQSVRRAAASFFSGIHGPARRLENLARHGRQRGAGSACGPPRGTTRHWQAHRQRSSGTALPNPSLKRSANGRPPGPVWRYAVHFRQPGPGVLPSSPA